MKGFSSYHPLTLLIYYACVVGTGMFISSPVIGALSIVGALLILPFFERKQFLPDLLLYIMVFILIMVLNPLFSRGGVTVLFFMNGHPVTLEALVYGLSMSLVVLATLLWFKSFSFLMTSDRLLCLFGRFVPKLSIVLSTALRYIPYFRKQMQRVKNTQTAMGLYSPNGLVKSTKGMLRLFSVMVTWSLENAIETADSMNARGFGLKKRSQFSLFRFGRRDMALIALCLLVTAGILWGTAGGYLNFSFYPALSILPLSAPSFILYAAFGVLVLFPFVCEVKEILQWTYCKSKI